MSLNPLFLGDLENSDYMFEFDENEREYKEHFVAFLDILGFKNTILNGKCNEIYSILKEVRFCLIQQKCNWGGIEIEAYEHIHYRVLSDSVVLFIEAEVEDSFAALVDVCGRLQQRLANLETPVLLRGGISKGELYYEMDMLYGKGLTAAYLLESSLARVPRIVFLKETLDAGIKIAKYMWHIKTDYVGIKKDEDEIFYLNYIDIYTESKARRKEYWDKLLVICEDVLAQSVDTSVREKYIWLKGKIRKAIECDDKIKELYEEEKEINSKERYKEFLNDLRVVKDKIRETKVDDEL